MFLGVGLLMNNAYLYDLVEVTSFKRKDRTVSTQLFFYIIANFNFFKYAKYLSQILDVSDSFG